MNSTLKNNPLPAVMTVAGSDSGGGAGIQADLKTFAALGTFGTSALTAITAQNPQGVTAIEALQPELTARQIEAIGEYFVVGAVKTGMLASRDMVIAVADSIRKLPLRDGKLPPLVVDPVMVSASGVRLLDDDSLRAIEEYLIPMATVITPNLDEAAILAQRENKPLNNKQDMEYVAEAIQQRFGVPVLVKGGHLVERSNPPEELTNCLLDECHTHWISHARIAEVNTHGSGCTLSAAIAVELMRGKSLINAVTEALSYLHGALKNSILLGSEEVKFINHQYEPLKVS